MTRTGPAGVTAEVVTGTLQDIRDGLRAGMSLRQTLVRTARAPGSPLASAADALASGTDLSGVLRRSAVSAPPELASALAVLALQSRLGGDPSAVVSSLLDAARARAARRRQMAALTAQARMSARGIMLLTPSFLALLVALDPRGTLGTLLTPAGTAAVAGGLVLQFVAGVWIRRIIAGATGTRLEPSGLRRIPILRVIPSLLSKPPSALDDTAHAAETLALVLSTGAGTARSVEAVAEITGGSLGDALKHAVRRMKAGWPAAQALEEAGKSSEPAKRLASALAAAHRLGIPAAETLRALASELRASESSQATERMHKASVKVLLPLGLLVLPAFVLSCLVPLFLGGLGALTP